jgi:predicted enzyme related to lactoylglutathione lyase
VLSYPAAIPLSSRSLNHLADLIRTHRHQRRTRCRHLEDLETPRQAALQPIPDNRDRAGRSPCTTPRTPSTEVEKRSLRSDGGRNAGNDEVMTSTWKIELIPVPVHDVDRAKAFYERIGFHADHDQQVHEGLRFVQLTPPGSACSIVIGDGITEKTPGTQEIQVVVADAHEARKQLQEAGVPTGDVDVQPWGNFVYFSDPDGNRWSLQAIAARPHG